MEGQSIARDMYNEIVNRSLKNNGDAKIKRANNSDITLINVCEGLAGIHQQSEDDVTQLKKRRAPEDAEDELEEFKAEDIFSDLGFSPEELSQKLLLNETTQTSQNVGSYFRDACVQTSQSLLGDSCIELRSKKNAKSDDESRSRYVTDEQVVPESTSFFVTPPPRSFSGKRRLGLSKRARLNPLHK